MNFVISFYGGKNTNVFSDQRDYLNFLRFMVTAKKHFHVAVYAFCLLPDQVSIVIGESEEETIASFVCALKQSYSDHAFVRYANKKILASNNEVKLCADSFELLNAIRTIEYLPVTRSIALHVNAYPYSSAYYRNLGAKTFETFQDLKV